MTDTIEAVTLERDGGAIECFVVPWDTATFGFPVAEITRFDLGADGRAAGLLADFDAWSAERGVRLVSCRLDHTKLRESMALEALGFRFVEMVHQPQLDNLDGVEAPVHDIVVDVAAHAISSFRARNHQLSASSAASSAKNSLRKPAFSAARSGAKDG